MNYVHVVGIKDYFGTDKLVQFDHINQMITLAVIPLSGAHCIYIQVENPGEKR
jgi:hypothetical protein